MADYDILIIGGGVIGLASAAILGEAGYSLLLIERHGSFAFETSSRNSEVIHAGIYYPQDSLKAKLCVPGNISLYEWSEKHNVPFKKIGKFIIATNDQEAEKLDSIFINGKQNGVNKLQKVTKDHVLKKEPHIKLKEAIFSPDTGIIDTHKLMQSFVDHAEKFDVDLAWKHTVKNIEYTGNSYSAEIMDPNADIHKIKVNSIINSAGLESDMIAQNAGIDIDKNNYRLNYCRGHYFRITPGKKHLAKRLIYPVPPDHNESLGIHITPDISGELRLGPDTMYLDERVQDYTVPMDLKQKFYESVSTYLDGIQPDDLYPDQSGIRPKLQKKGEPPRDFVIKNEADEGLPGLINLIGIESPGLTSSIEIAKYIKNLL